MDQQKEDIRIYVACLAAYNNGRLHGVWIDAVKDIHDIWTEIRTMLRCSPEPDAEEHAIHDYEGFEGLRLSEYEGLESVCEKAAFIAEHGRLGAEVAAYFGGDIEEARKALEHHYAGAYASLAEFAEDITGDTTEVPDNLRFYIDYERMGNDLAINDVIAIETGFQEVHIFWSH